MVLFVKIPFPGTPPEYVWNVNGLLAKFVLSVSKVSNLIILSRLGVTACDNVG